MVKSFRGINEPGAFSWLVSIGLRLMAQRSSMIPVYIYYQFRKFQRIGDLLWAAGVTGVVLDWCDCKSSSLNGEGLQHEEVIPIFRLVLS